MPILSFDVIRQFNIKVEIVNQWFEEVQEPVNKKHELPACVFSQT